MRIGEFAEKHNITQDTIRYYLDIGLLVTEKKGGQYKFSEADSRDIERIQELKELEFSLTEIQKILMFQRVSGSNTESFHNLYLPILETKKNEVRREIIKYNKMSEFLDNKINNIKTQRSEKGKQLGFPMNSLNLLSCPICRGFLQLSNGTIEENMLINADLNCECGHKAIIENGVYINEAAVRVKMLNGKRMPTKEEYVANCSYRYVNFLYKGMATLIEYINKYGEKPNYIMELSNCVGFFLLQYINNIPKDTTYILIDYDKERLMQLKKNLEMYYDHNNFIFLCCDLHNLPIKKSSMDLIVDFMMTRNYAESNNNFLPEIVLPFLRENGIFTSSSLYYKENSNDLYNLPENIRSYWDKDEIIKKLNNSKLREIDTIDIGPVIKNDSYNSDLQDKEIYQICYIGSNKGI